MAIEQLPQTESALVWRAKEFTRLIDSGNRADLRRYAVENFAPDFLTIPMKEHLDHFSWMQDITRGVELHGIQDETPNEVTLLLKSKLTNDWLALAVSTETKAPHGITDCRLAPLIPSPNTQPIRKLSHKQIAQELEAMINKLVEADVFSGAVLLAKDGVPIFKRAYGLANKDFNIPNQIDTKFNLGSMNKMFTAVAIAQLVERGQLSFDDTLSKFLPEFPDKDAAQKIRINHLLTHTAGLGGYFSQRWNDSARRLYRTVDDMMQLAAADEKLLFEPGTQWQYSNTGMLVLGKVVEIVTGHDYYTYVHDHIYQPAGMINTDCYELDKVNPNLAIGYDKQFTDDGAFFKNNIFEHVMRGGPHGGGYSTVEDLLKFDLALRSNKLVGPKYVNLLLSAKPELNSPNYGYGFGVDSELQIAGHGGGFTGVSANIDMFLGTGWVAIVMSNYSNNAHLVGPKMANLVLSDLNRERASHSR